MPNEDVYIYRQAIELWGADSQINQGIEELAELIVALNHSRRQSKINSRVELIDELADVLNMVNQIIFLFGIDRLEVESRRRLKLCSLEDKIYKARKL